jgi:hypothetical protein
MGCRMSGRRLFSLLNLVKGRSAVPIERCPIPDMSALGHSGQRVVRCPEPATPAAPSWEPRAPPGGYDEHYLQAIAHRLTGR